MFALDRIQHNRLPLRDESNCAKRVNLRSVKDGDPNWSSGTGLPAATATWKLRQENHKFKACLGHLIRAWLEIKY